MEEDLELNPGIGSESLVHRNGQFPNHVVKGTLRIEDENDGVELFEVEFPRIGIELTAW